MPLGHQQPHDGAGDPGVVEPGGTKGLTQSSLVPAESVPLCGFCWRPEDGRDQSVPAPGPLCPAAAVMAGSGAQRVPWYPPALLCAPSCPPG